MSVLQAAQLIGLEVLSAVSTKPNLNGLPGGEAAQKLLNGATAFGLLACLGAFVWGAAQWGYGSHQNNYSQADGGKSRMLKGVGGAFAIGAASAAVNFFFNAGSQVSA